MNTAHWILPSIQGDPHVDTQGSRIRRPHSGPIGGALARVTIGTISRKLKDYGIDDSFIKETRQALKPDLSAIFLLGMAELQPYQPKLLTTSLDPAEEQRLRQPLPDDRGTQSSTETTEKTTYDHD